MTLPNPPHAIAHILTNPDAWAHAHPHAKCDALPYIWDAADQVASAPTREARAAMLGRLPPHVAEIVKARVAAFWGGARVVFATDDSPEGIREAMREADRRQAKLHVLHGEGLSVVMEKSKAPTH